MTIVKIRKNSISSRLMMYFVCIVLFPIVILSLVMQSAYQKSIMKMAENTALDSLELINYNLDRQFKNYEYLAYFVSKDQQLQDIIVTKKADIKFNQLLNSYRSSVGGVKRIGISYENGTFFSTDSDELLEHEPEKQEWYQKCKQEQTQVHVMNYAPNEEVFTALAPTNTEILSVCMAMHDKKGDFIGAINLEMYSQILEESMSNILSRNGAYVYVLAEKKSVVYSPVVQTILEPEDKTKYCTVQVYNNRNKWTIVGVVPVEQYLQQIQALQNIMVIVLLIITFFMGLISLKVGSSIVHPIATLRSLMKQAENGDLTVNFQSKAPEEIKDLGESFNIMLKELARSIEQVREEQKAKRKAEIAALQANIKPHFLYNTLDTIHWMAKSYRAWDIVKTVDALSTLFRISLSKGSETIPIEQEIQHVTSYLQIQKVRYEEMIEYDIRVARDCRDFLVQKLILQPLVENAIYHGIKESGKVGKILVNVWKQENEVFLVVEDNGIGMSKERLKQVNQSLELFKPQKDGAYGVVNVHQRVSLNYGSPFGLTFRSEEKEGTVAIIRHPVLWEECDDTSVNSR